MWFAEARRVSHALVRRTFRMLRDAVRLALCCDPRRVGHDMPVGLRFAAIPANTEQLNGPNPSPPVLCHSFEANVRACRGSCARSAVRTYMPRGLRAGFRLDAMIRRASRRWLSSASSAI